MPENVRVRLGRDHERGHREQRHRKARRKHTRALRAAPYSEQNALALEHPQSTMHNMSTVLYVRVRTHSTRDSVRRREGTVEEGRRREEQRQSERY